MGPKCVKRDWESMPRKTGGERKEEHESWSIMWSNCPKGHQRKPVPFRQGAHCPHLVVAINTELAARRKTVLTMCQGANPSVISTSMQNGNKHNISIVNFRTRQSWNVNVKATEANKFCIFSCRECKNDPEESFQGSGRNIIVITPLVNILHIHLLCFVYGNVLMNLLVCFWMKLSLPLLLFVFFTDAPGI